MRNVLMLLACAVCAVPVNAQQRRFEISPFAGGYFSTGFQSLSVPSLVFSPSPDALPTLETVSYKPFDEPNSALFGLRGSYDLTRRVALEGMFAMSPAGLEFSGFPGITIRPGGTTSSTIGLEQGKDTFHYHGNILYHWRLMGDWSPFVTGGWGVVQRTSSKPVRSPFLNPIPIPAGTPEASYSRNSFSINFGGGVKRYFTDRYGIRFDFRNYISQVSGDTVNNMEASVGLIFRM